MEWIEKILQTGNITEACYEVIRNKGAAGVDMMNVSELKAFLDKNRKRLEDLIRNGQYLPEPIRGKEIPKQDTARIIIASGGGATSVLGSVTNAESGEPTKGVTLPL